MYRYKYIHYSSENENVYIIIIQYKTSLNVHAQPSVVLTAQAVARCYTCTAGVHNRRRSIQRYSYYHFRGKNFL